MRSKIFYALIFAALLVSTAAGADGDELQIRPNPDAQWNADIDDVRAVLNSAARELYRFFPGIKLDPIRVEPKGGPIVLFDRSPYGEYRVKLDTGGLLWAQYSFQFSHEFCHILCRSDRDIHPNKWFEESICELASLFTMRRMAETWKTEAPYPNWQSYSEALSSYARDRIDSSAGQRRIPLAQWFEAERDELAKHATLRQKNAVVAAQLLDLFEKEPAHWRAVYFLNVSVGTEDQTFEDYLLEWRNNAPYRHHEFIEKIAERFGISLKLSRDHPRREPQDGA